MTRTFGDFSREWRELNGLPERAKRADIEPFVTGDNARCCALAKRSPAISPPVRSGHAGAAAPASRSKKVRARTPGNSPAMPAIAAADG
jgi:hypothetical protein